MLLSSHLLTEVEAVADRIVIIGDGRIMAQGTRAELLNSTGTSVLAHDTAGLVAALSTAGLTASPTDGGALLVDAEPEAVARAAMADGVVLSRLGPSENAGLERLFFELTAAPPSDPQTNLPELELTGASA